MTEIKINDIIEYMNYGCKLNIFLLNYIKDHKLIGSIGPQYEYDNSRGYGYNLVEYATLYVYGYVPNLNISEVSGIHNLFIRTNDAVQKLKNYDLSEYKIPMKLKRLDFTGSKINKLPNLKNHSIKKLVINSELLEFIPELPDDINELEIISCPIEEISKLPNNIKKLIIKSSFIKELPELPKSLKKLYLCNNELNYLSDLPDNIILNIDQNEEMDYIEYNKNILIEQIKISVRDYGSITNKKEYDLYGEYLQNKRNRIKSARN